MSNYKLNYFNVRGRGETARMLFVLNDVPFEDIRFSFQEWPEHKPNMVFYQLPVLEVDGMQIAHSDVICKFLAKRFDMAGKDAIEEVHIDMVAAQMLAMQDKLGILYFSKDEAAKTKAQEDVLPMFKALDAFISKNDTKSGYFVGNKMSWVDVKCYEVVCSADHWAPDAVKDCSLLCALRDRIGEIPQIKKWVAERGEGAYPNI